MLFLYENNYKFEDIIALEAKTPLSTQISFGEDDDLDVLNLYYFDFNKIDYFQPVL